MVVVGFGCSGLCVWFAVARTDGAGAWVCTSAAVGICVWFAVARTDGAGAWVCTSAAMGGCVWFAALFRATLKYLSSRLMFHPRNSKKKTLISWFSLDLNGTPSVMKLMARSAHCALLLLAHLQYMWGFHPPVPTAIP